MAESHGGAAGRPRIGIGWPLAAGVALGIASFCADLVDGTLRTVLQFVASTGFAWGCAAFVAAFPARTRRGAAAAAIIVLCTATGCYYWLNLPGGFRPGGQFGPLFKAFAYWMVLSVVGGALLGPLAHAVRTDRARRAAVAAGVACGLLSGAGIAIVTSLLAAGNYGRAGLTEGMLQAAAGIAVATWAFARRRAARDWAVYGAAALAACTAGALAWSAVESVPVTGF
ncbi:hypothetical protein Dvina_33020 [Dactylosporangium vinaceum]|uniref:DUF6518 family protein n=1 Tax=Dactylosporangium vinaceum TaxID=53362 RepID=A0ABV5MA47_9ACTN|nr:DUF6518 family protein [Dactylosporangium vinaceum]UAB93102.1 hypothetical protein Dvina_33020 [Dactylosporangium vinaceum]